MKNILFFFAALFFLPSCNEKPTACFTNVTPEDSMFVHRDITFDGTCSSTSKNYYWDLGGQISNNSKPTVQFDSAGVYTIFLLVSNGKNTNSIKKDYTIKP